ncbi:hypothetical protein JTB14_030152 [Gonioctena quinquepunctata]|nr:hypothetical protein JTB14_030152 [Gonioctena quinquepunctata]
MHFRLFDGAQKRLKIHRKMHDNYAVYVENVKKSYGNKEVLTELYMKVERGIIYGLLGASGCGKTTLLSSIVGRKKIDGGEIWVLGGKPGEIGSGVPGPRVGYMPQVRSNHLCNAK